VANKTLLALYRLDHEKSYWGEHWPCKKDNYIKNR